MLSSGAFEHGLIEAAGQNSGASRHGPRQLLKLRQVLNASSPDRLVGARPAGYAPPVIDKLNNEINASLADPKLKARIADFGGTVFALSPAGFGKFIADETEKWAKVIRAANIKPA